VILENEERGRALSRVHLSVYAMLLGGMVHVVVGLAAVVANGSHPVARAGPLGADALVWAGAHLLAGLVLALSGVGVLLGVAAARVAAVIAAGLGATAVAFTLLPYSPLGVVALVAVDLAVVVASTVPRPELAEAFG
jgi:hypothetical protein